MAPSDAFNTDSLKWLKKTQISSIIKAYSWKTTFSNKICFSFFSCLRVQFFQTFSYKNQILKFTVKIKRNCYFFQICIIAATWTEKIFHAVKSWLLAAVLLIYWQEEMIECVKETNHPLYKAMWWVLPFLGTSEAFPSREYTFHSPLLYLHSPVTVAAHHFSLLCCSSHSPQLSIISTNFFKSPLLYFCTIDHLFVFRSLSVSLKPALSSAMSWPLAEAAIKIYACGFPSCFDLTILVLFSLLSFPQAI